VLCGQVGRAPISKITRMMSKIVLMFVPPLERSSQL
jgi:hypothetical protein